MMHRRLSKSAAVGLRSLSTGAGQKPGSGGGGGGFFVKTCAILGVASLYSAYRMENEPEFASQLEQWLPLSTEYVLNPIREQLRTIVVTTPATAKVVTEAKIVSDSEMKAKVACSNPKCTCDDCSCKPSCDCGTDDKSESVVEAVAVAEVPLADSDAEKTCPNPNCTCDDCTCGPSCDCGTPLVQASVVSTNTEKKIKATCPNPNCMCDDCTCGPSCDCGSTAQTQSSQVRVQVQVQEKEEEEEEEMAAPTPINTYVLHESSDDKSLLSETLRDLIRAQGRKGIRDSMLDDLKGLSREQLVMRLQALNADFVAASEAEVADVQQALRVKENELEATYQSLLAQQR